MNTKTTLHGKFSNGDMLNLSVSTIIHLQIFLPLYLLACFLYWVWSWDGGL